MALKVDNSQNITSVNIDGKSINELQLDSITWWCRPFTLSFSIDLGISDITVERTKSKEPSAKNISVGNGDTIYWKDTLQITATAKQYYVIKENYKTTLSKSLIVNGDTKINIESYKLLAPQIEEGRIEQSIQANNTWLVTVYITNPNNISVDIEANWIGIYNDFANNTHTHQRTDTISLNAHETDYISYIGKAQELSYNLGAKLDVKCRIDKTYSESTLIIIPCDFYESSTTTTTTTTQENSISVIDKQGDWELYAPTSYKEY